MTVTDLEVPLQGRDEPPLTPARVVTDHDEGDGVGAGVLEGDAHTLHRMPVVRHSCQSHVVVLDLQVAPVVSTAYMHSHERHLKPDHNNVHGIENRHSVAV